MNLLADSAAVIVDLRSKRRRFAQDRTLAALCGEQRPDVEVPAEEALEVACGCLLDALLEPPVDPGLLNTLGYQWLGEQELERLRGD